MGKGGGELWDDSALVDAFDRAMATYKEMHNKSSEASPSEEGKAEGDTNGGGDVSIRTTNEHIGEDDSRNELPSDATEMSLSCCGDEVPAEQVPLQVADPDMDLPVSESQTNSSGFVAVDTNVDSSNHQNLEYNELLRKYYELEGQSQKVLQQLYQTNYWNYETPGQSSTYQQQQQLPAYSATAPNSHPSSAECSCCCLTVPLLSVSCGANGQSCGVSACAPLTTSCSVSLACDQCPNKVSTCSTAAVGTLHPTKESASDDGVAEAAMKAAESAVNFMRSTLAGDPGSLPRKDKEEGKVESTNLNGNQNFGGVGLDGDLAVVLNAWYAAGFHTCRYLMQHSAKSSR